MTAACRQYDDPQLFDSTSWADHCHAREACATCPETSECLAAALRISREGTGNPDGTWAGLLWRDGHVITQADASRPAAVCGTDSGYYRHRRHLHEPACDSCKAAHAAAIRGPA